MRVGCEGEDEDEGGGKTEGEFRFRLGLDLDLGSKFRCGGSVTGKQLSREHLSGSNCRGSICHEMKINIGTNEVFNLYYFIIQRKPIENIKEVS